MSRMKFGDTMVPNIELDYILVLGYSILYKEYNLTGFNHQKNATHMIIAYFNSDWASGFRDYVHIGFSGTWKMVVSFRSRLYTPYYKNIFMGPPNLP